MNRNLIAAAVGSALLMLPLLSHAEDSSTSFKLRGFGTVGVTHSSQDQADYRNSLFQPSGAGHTRAWDLGLDTRLGLQGDLTLNDKLSAVVQLISERNYDKTFKPNVEWANFKYQITPDLSVRAGRVALPMFMLSEYRKVGYANPWVRTPVEVYAQIPFSSLNGVDVNYRLNIGDLATSLQATAGKTQAKLPSDRGVNEVDGSNTAAFNALFEYGPASVRLGYARNKVDYTGTAPDTIFGGFRAVANNPLLPGLYRGQAQEILDQYEAHDKLGTFAGIGVMIDPGSWFVQGEYTKRKVDSFLSDTTGYYVTGGARIGKFTPYASYSRLKADSETSAQGVGTAGLPASVAATIGALNSGLNAMLSNAAYAQKDVALGVRYDFMKNVDVKLQWDRLKVDGAPYGNTLINVQQGFNSNDKIDLFSLAVDFVF